MADKIGLDPERLRLLHAAVQFMLDYQKELVEALGAIPYPMLHRLGDLASVSIARGPLHLVCCKDYLLTLVENGFDSELNRVKVDIALGKALYETWDELEPSFRICTNPVSKICCIGHEFHLGESFSLNPRSSLTLMFQKSSAPSLALPRYSRAVIMGWEYAANATETPKELAVKSVRRALSGLHLATRSHAERLLHEYCVLLGDAEREEDLHQFLKQHPEFICPYYASCLSKPTLGGERVPDFAISYRRSSGTRWLFVEIERPDKPIFTGGKEPQFSAKVEQAKKQIRDWQVLLRGDPVRFSASFPELSEPEFLIVYGRDAGLDAERRAQLRMEFSDKASVEFCTYDDLANRYSEMVAKLELASPEPITKAEAIELARTKLAELGVSPHELL